ncbi:MAG TPA: recombination protein O N-terminal domain-containing protein [Candidatus Paceibacterota bacterium]|nr:recombination protein O N-terminal domain-containing protein [Candidatus Paceibacterota bacterium]
MSYEIYSVDGIILGAHDRSADDKVLIVLTERFGKIAVVGKSLRKLSSKLRMGAAEHTLARMSLIRGRNVWRLTDIVTLQTPDPKRRKEYARLSWIASAITIYDEPVSGIYIPLSEFFKLTVGKADHGPETRTALESWTSARMLYAAGFLPKMSETIERLMRLPLEEIDVQTILGAEFAVTAAVKVATGHIGR